MSSQKQLKTTKKALSLNEKDQSAMYNLSLAYKQNKKFDKAINFISKVIALDPSNKDYHLSKGIIYHEMRNEEGKNEYLDFAIEAFDDVIKLDAENEVALKELVFCHSRRGHIDGTIENCEKLLAKDNENCELRTLLAFAYFSNKEYKKAISEFLKIKDSKNPPEDIDLNLAFAYDKNGEKVEAKKYYKQFMENKPNHFASQQLKVYFEDNLDEKTA